MTNSALTAKQRWRLCLIMPEMCEESSRKSIGQPDIPSTDEIIQGKPIPAPQWDSLVPRARGVHGEGMRVHVEFLTCWNWAGIGFAYGTFFWGTFFWSFCITSSIPQSKPGIVISISFDSSFPVTKKISS